MNNLLNSIKILRKYGVDCRQYQNKQGKLINEIEILSDIFNLKEQMCPVRIVFNKKEDKIVCLYIAKGPAIFNNNMLRLIRKTKTFLNFDRDNIHFKNVNYTDVLTSILNMVIFIDVKKFNTLSKKLSKKSNKYIAKNTMKLGDLLNKIRQSNIRNIFKIATVESGTTNVGFYERVTFDSGNSIVKDSLIKSICVVKNTKGNSVILQVGSWMNESFANLSYEYLDGIKTISGYEKMGRDLATFRTNDIDTFLKELNDLITEIQGNGNNFLYK